jgi:hypothetical protein
MLSFNKGSCGFYPGLHPGQHRSGTTATFEEARDGFEADWKALSPKFPIAHLSSVKNS